MWRFSSTLTYPRSELLDDRPRRGLGPRQRQVLIAELIETVTIYASRLEVTVTGAPPLLVTLDEVGLRSPGTGSLVSEGGLEPPRPLVGH